MRLHWEGEAGAGLPVVDDDQPAVYVDLVRHAAEVASRDAGDGV